MVSAIYHLFNVAITVEIYQLLRPSFFPFFVYSVRVNCWWEQGGRGLAGKHFAVVAASTYV